MVIRVIQDAQLMHPFRGRSLKRLRRGLRAFGVDQIAQGGMDAGGRPQRRGDWSSYACWAAR